MPASTRSMAGGSTRSTSPGPALSSASPVSFPSGPPPGDPNATAAYLAGPDSTFVSGAVLAVDARSNRYDHLGEPWATRVPAMPAEGGEIGGSVSVIDPATQAITKKITFQIPGVLPEAIQPVGVRVTRDGALVFVALGPANRVAVIDGATDEVLDYLLVGQRVWQMGFTPDDKFLFTTNGNSNDVSVIDVAAMKVVKSVPVGQQPWGVVVAPN